MQMFVQDARKRSKWSSFLALLSVLTVLAPTLAGCGRSGSDQTTGGTADTVPAPAQKPGMSTGKKVAIIAGAAALLYLYNRQKNAKGTGKNGQYYRSKNGRVYYRDEKGNAVYVTPPASGIQVPADEAERYNRAAKSGGMELSGPAGAGSL
ncbi:MAG: hypothetical protein H7Z41_13335 [Cytophagales bacterium]|nr:hypothetical protein [Armatimonadota bacterium]